MKEVIIEAREMIVVNPLEIYGMPDEIADQLVARGKARVIEKSKPDAIKEAIPEKKASKEGK